jgi:hypothetical protein
MHQFNAAAARQFHPRVDVGGVLDRRRDDAVAGAASPRRGDDADPLAGVLDEGDLVLRRVIIAAAARAE